MKQTIITILLALVAINGQAQIKCHIIGTVAEGTIPVELRIYRSGDDPRNSVLRPIVKDGRFECDVEDTEIERWYIVDFGEVMEKGMTRRNSEFFVEDGATITAHLDGDVLDIQSSGKEFQAWHTMEKAAEENWKPAYDALDEHDDVAREKLEHEYRQWKLDYYISHPMLGFLLELGSRLNGFHYNDTGLASMLDIYHKNYSSLYPDHPVHQRIAEQEAVGYQIYSHKYSDYDVRTMDGQKVRASDYYKDKLTLVVCWASWCASCIREACDIIPLYEQYRDRGLNVFSLAHEFKSADAMRGAVERHAFPWPCLVDIDDEFNVFKKHGTENSALFLIDRNGNIIAVPYDLEELKAKLKEIFGE